MSRLAPLVRQARPFGLLWLAASAPLVMYALLYRDSAAALLGFVLQLFIACLLAALPVGHRALRWGLLAVLALVAFGGVLERELSKTSWQVSDKAGLPDALRGDDTVTGYGFRGWRAPEAGGATIALEARLVSGKPAWDWFRSDAGFVLEPQSGTDYPHTRVRAPAASPGGGSPYLMRTYDSRAPIGGRIFRVVLDLRRAPSGDSDVGTTPAATESTATESTLATLTRGAPIGGRGCRGVLLQAWAERGGGRCLPVTLTDEWTRYSLSWRVPEVVDASVVRILLSGFAGETFDVRRVRLFNVRGALGPLLPQGGALQLVWGGRPEAHGGRSFMPGPEWRRLEAQLPPRPAGARAFVTAHLHTASGLTLETRNVRVTDGTGQALAEVVSSARQTVVFGDPNLAGHTVGTLGLAVVALSSPPLGVLGGALTLLGLALTGSRAALVGTLAGLLWLFWLGLPKGWRRRGFAALGLGGAVLVGLTWSSLAGLRLLTFGEAVARGDIWRAATAAFLDNPGRGLGTGGFTAFWDELPGTGAAGTAVTHAHNVWLEFAAAYGVLGLLSAACLTLGLLVLAWRGGGARASAFVVGVLVMNVFDTTLVYAGVLFPLFLALGVFRRDCAPVEANRTLPRFLKGSFTPRTAPFHAETCPGGHTRAMAAPPPESPTE